MLTLIVRYFWFGLGFAVGASHTDDHISVFIRHVVLWPYFLLIGLQTAIKLLRK
jgi:hypothetical protein